MFLFIFILILGLCIGSFINAFQYRAQKELTLSGRSFCPDCKHQLYWYDLLPVVSWVLLSGRCRYCRKKISIQYPLVELLTAVLIAGVTLKSGLIYQVNDYLFGFSTGTGKEVFLAFLALGCLILVTASLIILALHDAKTGYILSAVVYFAIIASAIYLLAVYTGAWAVTDLTVYFLPYILSALGLAAIFFLITIFSKEKLMGAGDSEIALLMGVFLGWPLILTGFYVALLVGIIVSGVLLLTKKATLKSEIPFGPFLIIGTFTAYFFADTLIFIYAKIFLGA